MNVDPVASGSTMAGYMDIIVPLLVAEGLFITAASVLYFLAVHTRFPLPETVVERVFGAFRRVRKVTGLGFAVSFFLFYVSLFMVGLNSIALRDTSLALFLLVGWSGLLRGVWLYFNVQVPRSKKKAPGKRRKR